MSRRGSVLHCRMALACGVALYVAAAGNVAAGGVMDWMRGLVPASKGGAFRQVKLPALKPLANDAGTGQGIYAGHAQLNRVLQASEDAFIPEAGLTGQHDYIIELSEAPLTLYQGELPGLQKTARKSGKTELSSRAATQYRQHLQSRQQQVKQSIQALGIVAKSGRQFTLALNGLTMHMSQHDAARVAELPGIKRVKRSRLLQLNTDRGPAFIGADQVWQGNIFSGSPYQGEGVVVGIIDTGINTDHPSFQPTGSDGYTVSNPRGSGNYLGDCIATPSLCNDKLIGVYSYREITDSYADPRFQPDELWWNIVPLRPANGEDYNGHGSHTASTAAGNSLLNVSYLLPSLGVSGDGNTTGLQFMQLSGVAPHANLIAYQVCYPGGQGDLYAGCPETAILAGIEQAITDGVDVINMSLGGSESDPWTDSVERALLAAREAGINVAASAGNAGDYYTADHVSPWVLSVGAATHDRSIDLPAKQLTDMTGGSNPQSWPIDGESISGGLTANPIVWAGRYSNPNASDAPELCNAPFPAGTFANDPDGNPYSAAPIVVCKRGGAARMQKAGNVLAGGAGGFVLYNAVSWATDGSTTLYKDPYPLPGINIDYWAGLTLESWLATGSDQQATLTAAEPAATIDASQGDFIADFSSKGPSRTTPNHIVPSLVAPGVQIYAAFADDQPFTNGPQPADFTTLDGTSMASPHAAGALALVRQAHPDWSAAEVQSALMLTATQTPAFMSYGMRNPPDSPYAAGSGRVDVAAAVDAGLVMDETAANYLSADPANGGRVEWLNHASMANLHCQGKCTWLRKFRATRDGSWSVSTSTAAGYESLQLSVMPTHFTVTAGQTVDLQVTATINSDVYGRTEDRLRGQFFGEVALTEDSNASPTARLKVAAGLVGQALPRQLDLTAHRDRGQQRVNNLNLPSAPQLTTRIYGLTAPTIQNVDLHPDSFSLNPFDDPSDGAHWQLITVPAGTKRLVVEALSLTPVDWTAQYDLEQPYVLVGIDANSDGLPPSMESYRDELRCMSFAKWQNNFCSIQDPTPGQYWLMLHNARNVTYTGELAQTDRIRFAYALVGAGNSGELNVQAPNSHDGAEPLTLTFDWQLDNLEVGDLRYGALDVGPSAAAAGAFGMTAIRFERAADDATLTLSKTAAKAGDVIDMTLRIQENLDDVNRAIDIQLQLPSGLTVVPDSLQHGSNLNGMVTLTNGTLTVAGQQPTTAAIARRYVVTSNDLSEGCRVPNPNAPQGTNGYLDLFGETGMQPENDFGGDANTVFRLPIDWLFYKPADIELFAQASKGWMDVSPAGLIRFDDLYWPWDYPVSMTYGGGLLRAIAPFWRGSSTMEAEPHWEDPKGLTLATVWKEDFPELGDLLYLEWDNVVDANTGDQLDFEVVLRNGIDFEPNKPEIVFAYNNLSGANSDGVIGVRGYAGSIDWDAGEPLDGGWLITDIGYNNLDQVLSNNKVFCLDYDGPERSRMEISFQARVSELAAGTELVIDVAHQVGNVPVTSRHIPLPIAGNLQLADIEDREIDEDEVLEDVAVPYSDADNLPNTVTVSGDHVSATMHDDGSFDLIPEPNFNGQTVVTVTVADVTYPNDRSSTQFTLTVNPVNDAPTATVASGTINLSAGNTLILDASRSQDPDADLLSFQWQQISGATVVLTSADRAIAAVSNLANGSYEFRVTVSDGQEEDTANVKVNVSNGSATVSSSNGGGGSMPMLFGLLVALALCKRRRQ